MDRFIIPLIIVAALAGIAWHFEEERIREWIGWPSEEMVAEKKKDPKSPFAKREDRTTSAGDEAVEPADHEPDDSPGGIDVSELSNDDIVERILHLRYPDPELPSVDTVIGPDFSAMSPEIFPLRVEVSQQVVLTETDAANNIVARAIIVPGGSVIASGIEDGQVRVHSIGREAISGRLPFEQVALREAVARHRDNALERARARIEAAREADRAILADDGRIRGLLRKSGNGWEDPDTENFKPIRESIAAGQAGAVTLEDLQGMYWNGPQIIESGPFWGGRYVSVTVCFKADTTGLGPLPWRTVCLVDRNEVAGWLTRIPAREE